MTATNETAADDDTAAPIVCSFCIKPTTEVTTMVAGPGVFICDVCVSICVDLIANKPEIPHGFSDWEGTLTDDGLLATLPQIAAAGEQAGRRMALMVAKARTRGITWTRIGAALGMTRQSAWERFSGEE